MTEDTRITEALAHSHYKVTLVQQRENLKLKYANALLHHQNGGIFTITSALLAMVDLMVRHNQTDAVLIDDKGMPIRIDDLVTFLEEILSIYGEAANDYHVAWESLRKARSVEAIINK